MTKKKLPTDNCWVWATDGVKIQKLRYCAKLNAALDCTCVKPGDFTIDNGYGDYTTAYMKVTHWKYYKVPELPMMKG